MTSAPPRLSRVIAAAAGLAFAAGAPAAAGEPLAGDKPEPGQAAKAEHEVYMNAVRHISASTDGKADAQVDPPGPGELQELTVSKTVLAAQAAKGKYLQYELVSAQVVDWNTASTSRAKGTATLAQYAINGNSLGACTVGARHPGIRVSDGRNSWALSSVTILGCTPTSMTLAYGAREALR